MELGLDSQAFRATLKCSFFAKGKECSSQLCSFADSAIRLRNVVIKNRSCHKYTKQFQQDMAGWPSGLRRWF